MAPPRFFIVGGINGAGKSTLTRRVVQLPELHGATVLNPDTILQQIAGPTRDPPLGASLAALRETARRLDALLASGESVVAETVLANNTYRRLAADAMRDGYTVSLAFVGVRASRTRLLASRCE